VREITVITSVPTPCRISPAEGRLVGLSTVLGAVSATFISGVELFRRGMVQPVGSLA